jgi:hypothetical protein
MQLRIWKRLYLLPWLRLNLYTKGFTISVGHRGLGWITFGRRGIRATVPTVVPGAYFTESQQLWNQIGPRIPRRRTNNSSNSL